MAPTKGAAILDGFEELIGQAEAFREANRDSAPRKAARLAKSLSDLIGEGIGTMSDDDAQALIDTLDGFQSFLTTVEGGTFDKAEGDDTATKIAGLIAAGEDFQPNGFDAERAEALIQRWKAASGRRARGTGGSTTPPSAQVPVPVKVTFTYPDGADLKLKNVIQHGSTWSSVSAEITKRAMAIDGLERGASYTRPATAQEEWRAAVKSIKEGGDGGTVTVPTSQGDMVAVVEAVREAA